MTRIRRLRGPQGQELTLVAGITGLADDQAVVREALQKAAPARVLLGVPYEDLDAIRSTSGQEQATAFEAGAMDELYVERLKKYGPVQTPPPDLYEAYRYAADAKTSIDAIDLGDEAYTDSYTKNVGFFEVMRSNRQQRKAPDVRFGAATADEFVAEWDLMLNSTKGLRRVQQAREDAMADGVAKSAPGERVLALVPLARTNGVVERLRSRGWALV